MQPAEKNFKPERKLYKGKYRSDSTRLKNWDYESGGYYCLTICLKDKRCHFGKVINGEMKLSEIGMIAVKILYQLPVNFQKAFLDEFILMPDHMHVIIGIDKFRENPSVGNAPDDTPDAMNRVGTIRRDAIHRIPLIDEIPIDRIPNPHPESMACVIERPQNADDIPDAIHRIPAVPGGICGHKNPMLNESISRMVRWYKGKCTFEIRKAFPETDFSWQSNYYDSVIKTAYQLEYTRAYIRNNPIKYEAKRQINTGEINNGRKKH